MSREDMEALGFSFGTKNSTFNSPDELKYCTCASNKDFVEYVEYKGEREYFLDEIDLELIIENFLRRGIAL